MGYIVKSGSNLLKVGNSVFKVKDMYSYSTTITPSSNGILFLSFDPNISNNRLSVGSYYDKNIKILDATTLAVLATISVGVAAYGLCFDPVSSNNRLFVCCEDQKTINVYDSNSFAQLTQILTTGCYNICFDPISANNRFFVCNRDNNTLDIYDATSFNKTGSIPGFVTINTCKVDPSQTKIFIGDQTSLKVFDLNTLALLSTTNMSSIGGVVYDITFDVVASNNRGFIGTSSAGLAIINTVTLGIIEVINVGVGIRGVSFDPVASNNRLMVADFGNNSLNTLNQILS
jgi:DNA-binding beta-propeller fold protein YncE